MIVSIVGGHGSIARLLTPLLVARGHSVRALVRNDDQFDDVRSGGGSRCCATWSQRATMASTMP